MSRPGQHAAHMLLFHLPWSSVTSQWLCAPMQLCRVTNAVEQASTSLTSGARWVLLQVELSFFVPLIMGKQASQLQQRIHQQPT